MNFKKPIFQRTIFGLLFVSLLFGFQTRSVGFSEKIFNEKVSTSSQDDNQLDLFSDDLFIQKLSYSVQLTSSSYASTQIEMTIQNQGNKSLSFIETWLNGSYSSFFAYDAYGNLPFSWKPSSSSAHLLNVTLRTPLLANQTTVYYLQCLWDLTILENSEPSYSQVELPLILPLETDWLVFQLSLPSGNKLIDDPFNVIPSNDAYVQIHGENTLITWFLTPPALIYETPVVFSAKYAQVLVEEETENDSFATGTFFIGILIGISIGAIVLFLVLRSNLFLQKKEASVTEFTQMLFTSDEILILKTIEEKDGKTAQQEIEVTTGYSKSKVSRHLSLLEEKGLITRERFGRTNIVHLTEDARKYLTTGITAKEEDKE
jgi:uncharacterized membrane protein